MTRRGAVEVGFVLLAFYTFLLAVNTTQFMFWGSGWGFFKVIKALSPGAVLVIFGWALVAWRRELSAKLFPEEEEAVSPACLQEGAYRLGFVMLGVFTLLNWIPRALVTLMMLLDSLRASSSQVFPQGPLERMTPRDWQGLFASAVRLATGVYLLLGAPGLRQWLVKRARGDDEPQAPQPPGDEDPQPNGAGDK